MFNSVFIFLGESLQLLARFWLIGLLNPLGCRGFAPTISCAPNHQDLRIGIIDELWLQGNPSEISEFFTHTAC